MVSHLDAQQLQHNALVSFTASLALKRSLQHYLTGVCRQIPIVCQVGWHTIRRQRLSTSFALGKVITNRCCHTVLTIH